MGFLQFLNNFPSAVRRRIVHHQNMEILLQPENSGDNVSDILFFVVGRYDDEFFHSVCKDNLISGDVFIFWFFLNNPIFAKNIPLISALLFANKLRLTQNYDWVIFILIGCAFLYLFMMISLQRDSSIREFLLQSFADSSNGFASWVITGVVTCLTGAALISQYVPIVPKFVADLQLFGLQLNKFGFVSIALILFYMLKAVFTFFLFESVGSSKKWSVFYFTGTKFYFTVSLLLIILNIVNYYFSLDSAVLFQIYLVFFAVSFIFKIFFYIFHRNNILPNQWYYKFLYICTLQIAPVMLLWKLLFI